MNAQRVACLCAAIVGIALFGFVGTAAAADPTPAEIATARKLIELKGASRLYGPVLIGIIEKAKYTFLQTNPMLAKDLDAAAVQVRNDMQPELDQLKNEAAKIYASHFTQQELDEAYAFYKTPLGAKLIAVEPQILDQTVRYAADWANRMADVVMIKFRDEMRKRGHDL